MSDSGECYEAIASFIEEYHESGIDINRVVVPADDWESVKERAERTKENGVPTSKINGVTIVWSGKITTPKAEVKIDV